MKTNIHKKTHAVIPLVLIGIASSFTFVLTVVASGIVPSEVVALVNSARERVSLPGLTENAQLSEAARAKAEDMIKNDYFSHTSPKGVEPWYWIKQAGYQYQAAGENLAINYTNAKEQHEAWMKSTTHRANILNTRYQEIGVAVVKGKVNGKESLVTVEFFGSPLHAVADRVAVAPPVAVPVSEIKGMETPVVSQVLPTVPVSSEAVPSVPVVTPIAESQLLSLEWQEAIWMTLFLFSIVSAPMAFLARSFGVLIKKPRTETEEAKQPKVTIDFSGTPLYSHSIHHKIFAHEA
ncbi:MAG: hypothetical protein KBD27_00630 [Candidatus Moranbacteria bacterium]|nr:hypothetical protein [Candidatus Moranbacteria bacterium]